MFTIRYFESIAKSFFAKFKKNLLICTCEVILVLITSESDKNDSNEELTERLDKLGPIPIQFTSLLHFLFKRQFCISSQ